MRPLALAVSAVAIVVVLAGCIGGAKTPAAAKESSASLPGGLAGTGGVSTAVVTKPLSVAFTQDADWILPGTPVSFSALPVTGASGTVLYHWQYGDPLPMRMTEGMVHSHTPGLMDTLNIDPDASKNLTFAQEGIYYFHCHPHPWMKLNITVQKGALVSGATTVEILNGDTKASYRFAPADVVIAPGTTVRFHNGGDVGHTATEEGHAGLLKDIPGSGPTTSFDFPSAGDFRVVLTVTDGAGGAGQAIGRVLSDAERPSDKYENKWAGNVTFAGVQGGEGEQVPGAEVGRFSFVLEYPATLTGDFTASSPAPQPTPSVHVTLVKGDSSDKKPLAQGKGASGKFNAELPAGTYTVEVHGDTGVALAYNVHVLAKLHLSAPASKGAGSMAGMVM